MLNNIIESLSNHLPYIVVVIIASILGMVITFIVNYINRRFTFIKYIPGILCIFIGLTSLIMVLNQLFVRSSLTNIFIAVVALTTGICSLLFALCLGIYNKDRFPKQKKMKTKEM